jgi:PPOX class probable F420-dependent enzyme
MAEPLLTPAEREFLESARRAVLATTDDRGRSRLVPICFAVVPPPDARRPPTLWTPLDDKPKRTDDPLALARVRDILARPAVTVLVDRWSEDWNRLAWLRLYGIASLRGPGDPDHGRAIEGLRGRYPQYRTHALEDRPMIRIEVDRITRWGPIDGPDRR